MRFPSGCQVGARVTAPNPVTCLRSLPSGLTVQISYLLPNSTVLLSGERLGNSWYSPGSTTTRRTSVPSTFIIHTLGPSPGILLLMNTTLPVGPAAVTVTSADAEDVSTVAEMVELPAR